MTDCVFCRIAAGKLPAEIIYQDESVLAFKDIHPKARIHLLIIPRRHIVSLAEMKPEDLPVITRMLEAANELAAKQIGGRDYKLVINTGAEAGQVIMHLHMHFLAGGRINSIV